MAGEPPRCRDVELGSSSTASTFSKIGALDGTHIRVSLPLDEQVRYIGKTGVPTQNVLAVCDFDMRFTYVSTGQPGSMHDTSVLYNALSVDEKFFPHPPKGKNNVNN